MSKELDQAQILRWTCVHGKKYAYVKSIPTSWDVYFNPEKYLRCKCETTYPLPKDYMGFPIKIGQNMKAGEWKLE